MTIINSIKKALKNYLSDRDFLKDHTNGVVVRVPENDIDKLYENQEYEVITKAGPFIVRDIKKEVEEWCDKVKGKVEPDYCLKVEFVVPVFYFSRKEEAELFKKRFNISV